MTNCCTFQQQQQQLPSISPKAKKQPDAKKIKALERIESGEVLSKKKSETSPSSGFVLNMQFFLLILAALLIINQLSNQGWPEILTTKTSTYSPACFFL
jgi:hypothetical protein